MRLQTLVVGPFEVNCYLYWDEVTRDGLIIDPGFDENRIIKAVVAAGMAPKAILLTHGHVDHIAAVEPVKMSFNIPLYVGKGDEFLLRQPSANISALLGTPIVAPEPDAIVTDTQNLRIGSLCLRVIATPGHTPGGVCYFDETQNLLFCGDTLFEGSIGRTDLPGGSLPQLLDSIRSRIMTLPDGVTCYPGHGPATTVGQERMSNPYLGDDFSE